MKQTNKNKKIPIIIIILSIIFSLVLGCLLSLYFLFLHRYKGRVINNPWDPSMPFDINNTVKINKKKDKDFVILNFADIQLADLEDLNHLDIVKKELTYLVEQTKPDLITLTGDQTWSNENLISLTSIISWLDSFKIPYAPIFGNHDYGNDGDNAVLSKTKCADYYEGAQYCLFKRGPSNLDDTLGNYVINIMEDDKIYRSIFMIDSGYQDKITDKQKEWILWNLEGLKEYNNNIYPKSMMFMHKPIPEYYDAYYHYQTYHDNNIGDVHVHCSLYGSAQNGLFDLVKSKGVEDIVSGHEHWNNFTLLYQNVRLTFAVKTTEIFDHYEDDNVYLNGGSVFTLKEETTDITHYYVPRDMFKIK